MRKKKGALEEPKNRPREGGTSERERATILSIERETTGPAQIRGGEGGGGRKGGKRKGVLWRNQKTRRGGTSERERKTILSTKAAFPTSKGGFFFFVIPLVISADIRTQKMWVR